MPEPKDYCAAKPMDPARITLETLVWVPVWKAGEVIGWDYGHIIQIRNYPGNEHYIVCLRSTRAYDGTKQLHFAYSIACGICLGSSTRYCCQCSVNETKAIEHTDCRTKEFPETQL